MPELPEMEGVRAFLEQRLVGAIVADVSVAAISAIKTADPPIEQFEGRTITAVSRRGKYLLIVSEPLAPTSAVPPDLAASAPLIPAVPPDLAASSALSAPLTPAVPPAPTASAPSLTVAIHLSLAGWVKWHDSTPRTQLRLGRGPLAARFSFVSTDGEMIGASDLTEAGTKKRLSIHLVRALEDVPAIRAMGPEILDPPLDVTQFGEILQLAGGAHLKTVLRDQHALAGIGNAYSDEILHRARLSPAAAAKSLTPEKVEVLHVVMVDVLRSATDSVRAADDLAKIKDAKRSGLLIHGHRGDPCPWCGDPIRSVSKGESSHEYCATCQTGGRILADRRMSRLLK